MNQTTKVSILPTTYPNVLVDIRDTDLEKRRALVALTQAENNEELNKELRHLHRQHGLQLLSEQVRSEAVLKAFMMEQRVKEALYQQHLAEEQLQEKPGDR